MMDRNQRQNENEELIFPLCGNGYIIPCIRIFKILSNLTNKIQIVALIKQINATKYFRITDPFLQKSKWSYIMYNSVTGTLYGLSKNCWNLYGIPKSLVYGNCDGEHSVELLMLQLFCSEEIYSQFNVSIGTKIIINTCNIPKDYAVQQLRGDDYKCNNEDALNEHIEIINEGPNVQKQSESIQNAVCSLVGGSKDVCFIKEQDEEEFESEKNEKQTDLNKKKKIEKFMTKENVELVESSQILLKNQQQEEEKQNQSLQNLSQFQDSLRLSILEKNNAFGEHKIIVFLIKQYQFNDNKITILRFCINDNEKQQLKLEEQKQNDIKASLLQQFKRNQGIPQVMVTKAVEPLGISSSQIKISGQFDSLSKQQELRSTLQMKNQAPQPKKIKDEEESHQSSEDSGLNLRKTNNYLISLG